MLQKGMVSHETNNPIHPCNPHRGLRGRFSALCPDGREHPCGTKSASSNQSASCAGNAYESTADNTSTESDNTFGSEHTHPGRSKHANTIRPEHTDSIRPQYADPKWSQLSYQSGKPQFTGNSSSE